MNGRPSYPDPNGDTGDGTRGRPTTPRWVYVLGLIAIVLVLLFVVLHLTGGGLDVHTHGVQPP